MARQAHVTVMTPPAPGAIAIVQVSGPQAGDIISHLIGRDDWQTARLYLADLAGIDQGVAVKLNDHVFQLMPHGGLRVVQRIVEQLIESGAHVDEQPPAAEAYPEASSPLEADMLATIARAASPLAIDRLAEQPTRWREAIADVEPLDREAIAQRTMLLDHLVTPPTVVVVGPANVGKSTVTNRMLGRAASIVADLPGTTRDWVAGLAELNVASGEHADPQRAVAVRWLDTPGLRHSDDPIETRAIELARDVIAEAHVIIAMRDPDHDWPDIHALPRQPELWVMNKSDLARPSVSGDGRANDQPLLISAKTGEQIESLEQAVVRALGFDNEVDAMAAGPWAFSPTLKRWLDDGQSKDVLAGYLSFA